MAPTKKNSKTAYLADQEPTGAEIPAELNPEIPNIEEKDSSPSAAADPKKQKKALPKKRLPKSKKKSL